MDAVKCLLEDEAFFCHCAPADAPRLCAGYASIMAASDGDSMPGRAPWPFVFDGTGDQA